MLPACCPWPRATACCSPLPGSHLPPPLRALTAARSPRSAPRPQRIMARQSPKLSDAQQQNQTRCVSCPLRGGCRPAAATGAAAATLASPRPCRLPRAAPAACRRWAVYQAATLLRTYAKEYEALQEAMARGAPVVDCFAAIESA